MRPTVIFVALIITLSGCSQEQGECEHCVFIDSIRAGSTFDPPPSRWGKWKLVEDDGHQQKYEWWGIYVTVKRDRIVSVWRKQ